MPATKVRIDTGVRSRLMQITLRYGRAGLNATLPDANVKHILRFRRLPTVDDPIEATREGLRRPLGCPPLAELARGKANACIVTSDITRPVPNPVLLPPVLAELEAAGLPPERVTILIGTGSHRPSTTDEMREMLGDEVCAGGAQVANHSAFDPGGLVYRGSTSRGTPVYVNRLYAEADLRITAALVEPHLIAGFSGGRKAICPGICGIETLFSFHAPELVRPETACSGLIDGNPAHEESLAVARLAGAPDLTLNATLDESRRLTGVFVGELDAAHRAAVGRSLKQSKAPIPAPVDIAVTTGAGHPLDLTFYQSVKGLVAPLPILRPGGTIVAAHECAEGIGEPNLVRGIMETDDLASYEPRVRDASYFHMDQWYHQFSKVLRRASEVVSFCGGVRPDQLARCFVTPVESVEDGVARALTKHGQDASIAVLPEGAYVLPCLESDRLDRQRFQA